MKVIVDRSGEVSQQVRVLLPTWGPLYACFSSTVVNRDRDLLATSLASGSRKEAILMEYGGVVVQDTWHPLAYTCACMGMNVHKYVYIVPTLIYTYTHTGENYSLILHMNQCEKIFPNQYKIKYVSIKE